MMTIKIRNRMYKNIALLIFLLLTSIVAAFSYQKHQVPQNEKAPISSEQPSLKEKTINL